MVMSFDGDVVTELLHVMKIICNMWQCIAGSSHEDLHVMWNRWPHAYSDEDLLLQWHTSRNGAMSANPIYDFDFSIESL